MNDFKIKTDKKDEWMSVAGQSCKDSYSFGVVLATVRAFGVLDDPTKTPEDAEKSWLGIGLSGFMAGCAAQWVVHFHERGEEFRVYFNAQWGVDESKANGGVVNPALWST